MFEIFFETFLFHFEAHVCASPETQRLKENPSVSIRKQRIELSVKQVRFKQGKDKYLRQIEVERLLYNGNVISNSDN